MSLHPLFQGIVEAHGAPKARPDEPPHGADIYYRGWECGYDATAAYWGAEGWRAAKGGWDLDCQHTSGRTWSDLLDEIDAEEDDA